MHSRGSRKILHNHMRSQGSRSFHNSNHILAFRNNHLLRVCRRNNFLIQPNKISPPATRHHFQVCRRNNHNIRDSRGNLGSQGSSVKVDNQGSQDNKHNSVSQANRDSQGNPLHGGVPLV
jgi:hypothetical protein